MSYRILSTKGNLISGQMIISCSWLIWSYFIRQIMSDNIVEIIDKKSKMMLKFISKFWLLPPVGLSVQLLALFINYPRHLPEAISKICGYLFLVFLVLFPITWIILLIQKQYRRLGYSVLSFIIVIFVIFFRLFILAFFGWQIFLASALSSGFQTSEIIHLTSEELDMN